MTRCHQLYCLHKTNLSLAIIIDNYILSFVKKCVNEYPYRKVYKNFIIFLLQSEKGRYIISHVRGSFLLHPLLIIYTPLKKDRFIGLFYFLSSFVDSVKETVL